MDEKIGNYAFFFGVLLSVIAALGMAPSSSALMLLVAGLIIGALNVSKKETTKFLLASITLITVGAVSGIVSQIPVLGDFLRKTLLNITTFVAFAALVVALKTIHELAED